MINRQETIRKLFFLFLISILVFLLLSIFSEVFAEDTKSTSSQVRVTYEIWPEIDGIPRIDFFINGTWDRCYAYQIKPDREVIELSKYLAFFDHLLDNYIAYPNCDTGFYFKRQKDKKIDKPEVIKKLQETITLQEKGLHMIGCFTMKPLNIDILPSINTMLREIADGGIVELKNNIFLNREVLDYILSKKNKEEQRRTKKNKEEFTASLKRKFVSLQNQEIEKAVNQFENDEDIYELYSALTYQINRSSAFYKVDVIKETLKIYGGLPVE